MKKKILAHNLSWVAGLLLASTLIANAADLDRIAVVVNQDVVLMSEVRDRAQRIQASGKADANQPLIQQALDALVLEKLQLQAAKRSGIVADEASVERALANVAKRNNMPASQLQQAIVKEGINYENFKKNISNQLVLNSLKRRQSSSSAKISEQEVDDLIASESQQLAKGRAYHVQDLLIATPKPASVSSFNQARNQAAQLRKLAITSKDFMKTRFANSTATDLDWKDADQFSFAYLKELNQLAPGQVSDVIHDAAGFHVLKLLETRGGAEAKSQQVRVRHILIAGTEPDAKAKAEQVRLQLVQGGDFATLAKLNSADKESALNGGNLGWSDSKRYVPAFAKAAETLELNKISPLVQTQFGYHIIQVQQRREVDSGKASLQLQARKVILDKRQDQDYDAWVQGLRSNAFIDYRLKEKQ